MKLLLTGAFKYSEQQLNALKHLGYEILFVSDERIPLQIDVKDVDAVVCNGLFLYNDIEQFESLKFIQLTSAGIDRVPLGYIEEHGIKLFNAKGVYSIPMAEWVVLKILEIYKKSREFYRLQEAHNWEKQRDLLELTGKTAVIIGFGSVGTEIAKRLKVFGVNVLGVGRRQIESSFIDEYYLIKHIDDVLKKSDIVILTLPLTSETRNLLDANKISKMKDNSILINVSRGGVIDEIALVQALEEDKFLGVALDVFEKEPLLADSQFWKCDKVIVTPHNSFVSDKTSNRLFETITKNLGDYRVNSRNK
ncbi:NAD(P)-dependent oxidoreductase [Neobacillus niacini]|uniref:NAD(P)-dependent oxidoreductase n=1 Tax=Neobacillus niacini TaxID=86668 RepID=UPI0021CB0836|nr:NAD(P)-dependent oxidoreductase [Neobacillus niacini]MCM3763938.1 NAD(P)-binding domain-containing protein [Neobacillus niacini]